MTNENNPNAAYDRDRLQDPTRSYIDRRSPAEMDSELQIDPELSEGPATNTKIALFAVGIAVVLGAVFYGLDHSSVQQQASQVSTPANNQSSSTALPPAPPGMRDVTPQPNSEPGTTTGTAPANPQPPSPASTGPGGADTNTANPGNAKQ